MKYFTPEQIEELSEIFGIEPVNAGEMIKVRDGWAQASEMVWWHCVDGPQYVNLSHSDHLRNAKEYPDAYSIREPKTKITYIYD